MLRDNLATPDSPLGLRVKTLAGLVYASVVQDDTLATEARTLAASAGAAHDEIEAVASFAAEPALIDPAQDREAGGKALRSLDGMDEAAVAALLMAKAVSSSPAEVTPPILASVDSQLSPPAVIELLVWISVEQLLHRLGAFFAAG